MTNNLANTLASCLVNQLYQIEYSNDEQINEDFAVGMMEQVGGDLQKLSLADLSALNEILSELAEAEVEPSRKEYLESFVENFGLDTPLS